MRVVSVVVVNMGKTVLKAPKSLNRCVVIGGSVVVVVVSKSKEFSVLDVVTGSGLVP